MMDEIEKCFMCGRKIPFQLEKVKYFPTIICPVMSHETKRWMVKN